MIDPSYGWAFLVLGLAAMCFIVAGWLMDKGGQEPARKN